MECLLIVLLYFGAIIVMFALFVLIGHLLKLDDY